MLDKIRHPDKWKLLKTENGPDLLLFRVRYDWYRNPRNQKEMKRLVLQSGDWVNIVATTDDNKIILVNQYRFGSGRITTEIPAGLVDPGENSRAAAERELREETGYTTDSWTYMGNVEPNPAFQNNRCHHWFAQNVIKTHEPQLDTGEDIVVSLLSFSETKEAICNGTINHVLALSALSRLPFFWNELQIQDFERMAQNSSK